MDIAFDLDGTLVPGPSQDAEAAPWYVSVWIEAVRSGIADAVQRGEPRLSR